jgi:hypothetical protein
MKNSDILSPVTTNSKKDIEKNKNTGGISLTLGVKALYLVYNMGSVMIMKFMAVYLSSNVGLTKDKIGIVVTLQTAAAFFAQVRVERPFHFLSQFLWSGLSSRCFKPSTVLIISSLTSAISVVPGLFMVDRPVFWILITVILLQ